MPELATSEHEIVLYYNPKDADAKETYAYARGEGFSLNDVDITKTIFTGVQLEELAERLHTNVEGLVNKDHPLFETLTANADLDDDGWIKVLRKHPELIKQPIAIRGHQAMIVDSPSDLSRL